MVDGLRRYQGYESRINQLPKGQAWLLIEFGAQPRRSGSKARSLMNAPPGAVSVLLCNGESAANIWRIRESALAATAFIQDARPLRRLGRCRRSARAPASYLRELRALYNRFGYKGVSTVTSETGCVHTRIDFDLDTPQGIKDFAIF